MRLSTLALAAMLLATHAVGGEPIADQAARAFQSYAGGMSQRDFIGGAYARAVLGDIAGDWVRLDGPDDKSGATSYGVQSEKSCSTAARLTLSSPDAFTLNLKTNLPGANFTQVFTLIAGSTFGEHTDAAAYLTAIGLGENNKSANVEDQRAIAMSIANGLVQLHRPSPDILVMTRDKGYPTVLARCPAPSQ
jgi:hypothetical protein